MMEGTTLLVSLLLCLQLVVGTRAETGTVTDDAEAGVHPLVLLARVNELNDRTLRLRYELRNDSQQDVWICDNVSPCSGFEAYLETDGTTLLIRKCLDVPSSAYYLVQPCGKFTRLRPGEKKAESVSLAVPVRPICQYESSGQLQSLVYAKRVSIEIGYYVGHLPDILVRMLEETDRSAGYESKLLHVWFGGRIGFNHMNESLRERNEEILVPYTHQILGGERILRATIDNLNIPYCRESLLDPKSHPPDVRRCTEVKVEFEPSMFEYFYQYQSQRGLFSGEEIEYLRSQKTLIVKDSKRIGDFARELQQTEHGMGGIASEIRRANVSCYDSNRRILSFIVCDDARIETEHGQRIQYCRNLQSLRKCALQIQPFELRMQCAANLRNLWHRLRLYDRAVKTRVQSCSDIRLNAAHTPYDPNKTELENMLDQSHTAHETFKARMNEPQAALELVYPRPQEWCDSMEWAFVGSAIRSKRNEVDSQMKVHVCPTVGQALSTYAMNPNCHADSPADMVLLFETKAGWNQHGGPELFTFDKHDPKGGCVLLNDGTVKFIRTQEELQQLRWK